MFFFFYIRTSSNCYYNLPVRKSMSHFCRFFIRQIESFEFPALLCRLLRSEESLRTRSSDGKPLKLRAWLARIFLWMNEVSNQLSNSTIKTPKHSPWQTASSLLSRRFLCKQWGVTALPFIFGNRTRRVTRRVALMKAELQAAGGVVAWCIFVVGIASSSQVWSLTQSYLVDFSQSRISVKYGVHLIKVRKSCIWSVWQQASALPTVIQMSWPYLANP